MLISQLPDIIQKSFCTSDGAIDLTFLMNYVTAVYHVCSRRNEAKTVAQVKGGFFLCRPLVYISNSYSTLIKVKESPCGQQDQCQPLQISNPPSREDVEEQTFAQWLQLYILHCHPLGDSLDYKPLQLVLPQTLLL